MASIDVTARSGTIMAAWQKLLMLRRLRELSDSQIPKFDGRAFRFQAEVAGAGVGAGTAGDLFTVNPEPDFAVDCADVVVIPLPHPFAQALHREAAGAVRRYGREWRELRLAGGEHVPMGGEPVRFLARFFLVLLGVAVVQDLDFHALRELARLERVHRFWDAPQEDSGVSAGTKVLPFRDKLQVGELFHGSDYADRLTCAVDTVFLPGPGIRIAVDVYKIRRSKRPPSGASAVDKGFRKDFVVAGPGFHCHRPDQAAQ